MNKGLDTFQLRLAISSRNQMQHLKIMQRLSSEWLMDLRPLCPVECVLISSTHLISRITISFGGAWTFQKPWKGFPLPPRPPVTLCAIKYFNHELPATQTAVWVSWLRSKLLKGNKNTGNNSQAMFPTNRITINFTLPSNNNLIR